MLDTMPGTRSLSAPCIASVILCRSVLLHRPSNAWLPRSRSVQILSEEKKLYSIFDIEISTCSRLRINFSTIEKIPKELLQPVESIAQPYTQNVGDWIVDLLH